jgi:hypothetical protein
MSKEKDTGLRKRSVIKEEKPKFRDPRDLTFEQMTDPDYAIKQLKRMGGHDLSITCSKCHHCR